MSPLTPKEHALLADKGIAVVSERDGYAQIEVGEGLYRYCPTWALKAEVAGCKPRPLMVRVIDWIAGVTA